MEVKGHFVRVLGIARIPSDGNLIFQKAECGMNECLPIFIYPEVTIQKVFKTKSIREVPVNGVSMPCLLTARCAWSMGREQHSQSRGLRLSPSQFLPSVSLKQSVPQGGGWETFSGEWHSLPCAGIALLDIARFQP